MRRWIDILTETMTRQEAAAVFSQYGVDKADRLDATSLKAARRQLAKNMHADVGGSHDGMALVNAAYDVLSAEPGKPAGPYTPASPARETTPVWAWAGHSGGMPPQGSIYRNDYSDLNFFKKRMWELSGKSKEEWTIWNFDGRYFRGTLTVYGSEGIFNDMADAMRMWDRFHTSRAVFVSRKGERTLHLIWSDGEYRDPPIPFEHDSFNANPGNDSMFMYDLPSHLSQIRAEMDGDDGITIPKRPN